MKSDFIKTFSSYAKYTHVFAIIEQISQCYKFCLLWESYEIHKCMPTICGENVELCYV